MTRKSCFQKHWKISSLTRSGLLSPVDNSRRTSCHTGPLIQDCSAKLSWGRVSWFPSRMVPFHSLMQAMALFYWDEGVLPRSQPTRHANTWSLNLSRTSTCYIHFTGGQPVDTHERPSGGHRIRTIIDEGSYSLNDLCCFLNSGTQARRYLDG